MRDGVRIADDQAADLLWPAAKAAHLFADRLAYDEFRASGPWRVLAGANGAGVVLERWRDHLDILAARAIWASPSQLSRVIFGIEDVARDQGFTTILSPLVPASQSQHYVEVGFRPHQRIVVLRSSKKDIADLSVVSLPGVSIRLLVPDDIPELIEIDADCFDDFWRYEPYRLAERLVGGRTLVAESREGLIGYTHATIDRGSGTIGRLAVMKSGRRSGVGSALLLSMMQLLFRAGVAAVSLCTQEENAASRALYARVGLREMPERLLFLTKTRQVLGRGAKKGDEAG